MSAGNKYRRLDWAEYTDFNKRHSRDDLVSLCANKSASQLADIFSTRDSAGLLPLHWASINNRSDMIEFMLDNGAPLMAKCKNKLFADGNALHLAAMNGSLEAAAALLHKCRLADEHQTKPKVLASEHDARNVERAHGVNISRWLADLDAEGQSALMRSAPPRSKRLDTVRDLLRKNLWSLSARPAEMALFLICSGADWRQTDSLYNMNLMHWAIVNDYDDIVNLLLVIDKQLIDVPAKPLETRERTQLPTVTSGPSQQQVDYAAARRNDGVAQKTTRPSGGYESINLASDNGNSSTSDGAASSNDEESSTTMRPLIGNEEKSRRIMFNGLLPLQLAIVYARISMIGLIWYAQANESLASPLAVKDSIESQRLLAKKRAEKKKQLKRILSRAFWTNKRELGRFFRQVSLKALLVLDLMVLAVFWIPTYATTEDEGSVLYSARGGSFILAYMLSMVLAVRVILKNPGYLRRSSIQYFDEMRRLLVQRPMVNEMRRTDADTAQTVPLIKLEPETNQTTTKTPTTPMVMSRNAETTGTTLATNTTNATNEHKSSVHVDPRWQHKINLHDRARTLCHKCKCIRRPRSRHCNYCNHCVQDFDHHCIYLGCCIGRNNRLDFLVTMIVFTITSIYGVVLHATSLSRSEWSVFWHIIGLLWILKYVVIGGLTSFAILRRAGLGVTKYEQIRSKRIRKIFGPGGPSQSIAQSHKAYSTLKGSYWRYSPDRFLTGDLPVKTVLYNLREFTNFSSCDEYLLTIVCSDATIARTLTSSDSRSNLYKLT